MYDAGSRFFFFKKMLEQTEAMKKHLQKARPIKFDPACAILCSKFVTRVVLGPA